MKASELIKKYPDFWATVEAAVWDDCIQAMGKPATKGAAKILKRIAYNAAFNATYEHHKAIKVKND